LGLGVKVKVIALAVVSISFGAMIPVFLSVIVLFILQKEIGDNMQPFDNNVVWASVALL
jgi:hypothetical protein